MMFCKKIGLKAVKGELKNIFNIVNSLEAVNYEFYF